MSSWESAIYLYTYKVVLEPESEAEGLLAAGTQ